MAVFRVERTRDYTVMSNCHLRDKRLSLKAKGLLSQMLSLPDDWDYTLTGLSNINRESKDAVRSAVNELEKAGYIRRHQTTDAKGKFSVNEYVIYEHPVNGTGAAGHPPLGNPSSENPTTENPLPENPTQLNTEEQNTERQSTDSTVPFLSGERDAAGRLPDGKGRGCASAEEVQAYRELIRGNIAYDALVADRPYEKEMIDEIVELMVEVVSARREHIRVAGSDFPHGLVKSRFLKLGMGHIQFVLSCLKENTTKVKNIKQYLLTVLFLIMSDTDDSFNFLISMCYTQLFNLLCEKADDVYGGRLPVHVRCLIDEAANIGQIPQLEKLVATIRSREISACLVLQAQSQLKAIYKDNADTIIGNMDCSVFLGGKEPTTLKELAAVLGKETIDTYNTGESRGRETSHSLNYQKLGKELMSQDELAVMDGGKCILQLRGVRPFLSEKYDITKHPNYRYTADADPKNAFDIEKFLSTRLKLKAEETFDVYEINAEETEETE